MNYLERVNPSYFDFLEPLRKWKILNVQALREESEYQGSASGFYKIVSKLENNLLIDSFTNSWSNEKHVYLLPYGLKALGEEQKGLNINRDLRFHDSIVSKVARHFVQYAFVNEVYLDLEAKERFPLLERVPDILVEGELNSPFKMAIEVELTQKSQDRVKQIFKTYSNSKVINQVLYITDKLTIFKAYQKYLSQLGSEVSNEKILILHHQDLSKSLFQLEMSPVLFKKENTSLTALFGRFAGNA